MFTLCAGVYKCRYGRALNDNNQLWIHVLGLSKGDGNSLNFLTAKTLSLVILLHRHNKLPFQDDNKKL